MQPDQQPESTSDQILASTEVTIQSQPQQIDNSSVEVIQPTSSATAPESAGHSSAQLSHEKVITPLDGSLRPEDNTISVAPVVSTFSEASQQDQPPQEPDKPTGISPATDETIDNNGFAWLKIALAGFLIPITLSVTLLGISLVLDLLLGAAIRKAGSFSLPVISFFSPFYLILLILCTYSYVALCKRYVLRLSGYRAKRPLLISTLTFIFIFLCYIFMEHVTSYNLERLVETGRVGGFRQFIADVMPFAFPFLSALFLPLFTFMIERFKLVEKYRFTLVGVILVLPILATAIVHSVPPYTDTVVSVKNNSVLPNIKSVKNESIIPQSTSTGTQGGALVPSQLLAGITPSSECDFSDSSANLPYDPSCLYDFTSYPGYLSQATQSSINSQALMSYMQAEDFMNVSESPYNSVFKPYLYQDGQCDVLGIGDVMTIAPQDWAGNRNIPAANPVSCVQLTTPGGIKLFARVQYSSDSSQEVYLDYYFIKDGTIVAINVMPDTGLNSVAQTLVQDSNFKQQFYIFVDSFESK